MRRAMFWTGTVMVVAGLVLVGYFAWQFFGTNIVAKQNQEQRIEELQELWAKTPDAPSAESGEVRLGNASALIRIPRFGDDYVMPVLEGTSDGVLSQGYGHFTDTANPGEAGNYALAAHRITHGEPLRDMPELEPGDEVLVETREAVYTYVLDTNPEDLVVPFTAGWVLDEKPVNPDGGPSAEGKEIITLTTCSELFHTDDRMIAFGHLTSVEEKSTQ